MGLRLLVGEGVRRGTETEKMREGVESIVGEVWKIRLFLDE